MSTSPAGERGRPAAPPALVVRQLHLYLGVLLAPAIMFFAATGALQILGLHEAQRDGSYAPPAVIEKLSEVHIHARYAAKRKPPGPRRVAPRPAAPTAQPAKAPDLKLWAVKGFFLATAAGLILSSLLGLWMALTQSRRRRLAFGLMLAGLVLPILLLAL